MSEPSDWRTALLAGAARVDVPAARRNPARWPGYVPRPSVQVWRLPHGPVAAVWDFTAYGGSFGEDDATALVEAARLAATERRPLLTVVRSGGTRLQEGMAALVGIPRARLALLDLAAAGVPHLSVADAPTTGGVWISIAATADLRAAVEGATVGFAGPRVVEAVTGIRPPEGSSSATSAFAAGLVDAVLPGEQVPAWLNRVLGALAPATSPGAGPSPGPGAGAGAGPHVDAGPNVLSAQAASASGEQDVAAQGGWEQVLRARARTRSGGDLLAALLTDAVPLRAPRGDTTVAAVIGRLAGQPVVGVAVAAELGGRPTPDGYRLAARAYRLAGRLGLGVLSLVDTPGAEPSAEAEQDGIAPAMGDALDALLTCPTPTVALLHGEGGSGGALAAAAADRVLALPDSYFAALGPEGAAAALRRPGPECADLMRITPADLLALGAVDALVEDAAEAAGHLAELSGLAADVRSVRRRERWSRGLPGTCDDFVV